MQPNQRQQQIYERKKGFAMMEDLSRKVLRLASPQTQAIILGGSATVPGGGTGQITIQTGGTYSFVFKEMIADTDVDGGLFDLFVKTTTSDGNINLIPDELLAANIFGTPGEPYRLAGAWVISPQSTLTFNIRNAGTAPLTIDLALTGVRFSNDFTRSQYEADLPMEEQ